MCIFSGNVEDVGSTRIFARLGGITQYLAYEMVFQSSADVAMILPIPVEQPGRRDAVVFYDFSDYTGFFEDLDCCFPVEIPETWGGDTFGLEVHAVGSFHASYVPSVEEFSKLDERFRLAPAVWKELPAYTEYSFIVFQFRPGHQKPHPMAFSFPSAEPDRIYFPTTHVHDSAIHSSAEFDHDLYVQRIGRLDDSWELGNLAIADDETSIPSDSPFVSPEDMPRRSGVKIGLANGLIEPDKPLYRTQIRGVHDNTDIWVQ